MKPKLENLIIVGCSAEGEKAITYLVPRLKLNQKNAIVIVPHLASFSIYNSLKHLGICTSFLKKHKKIKGGRAYIATPGIGRFGNSLPSSGSIDYAMETLANHYNNRCIGVILSGFGNDGSIGIQHIKRVNGKELVQIGDSFPYIDEMPKNAKKTTEVNFAGPLSELANVLNDYLATEQK